MISRLLHIGRRVVIGAMMVFVAVCMNAKISATSVYVDKDGVMRNEKTGEEVSFFGTNYTAPFAFAYRAMEQTGIDHKKAIDRDVYHMARLGFNGFRLHLWDVELSDSIGNLVDNKHLDLLDYLISKLEERDIKIIITAQTNFGNGYPQPNSDPYGAFTYDYDKCRVHDDPAAIKAQERYITQLLGHKNRYTGRSFVDDPDVIALEVNNEPCHSGGEKVVKQYLSKMTDAIKKSGWKKPVLYNVSHNFDVTQAFYDSKIDGTTYQWYPLGLVGGFTRKGNFLPYVDQYHIPFADKVKGFDTKAKVVYEYDPADNLLSYLHPAIARTFRKEGFQWATQFAYDPIDIAWSNAEYQTHYLNLAYTPQKALSMMIAAEVMRNIERGADFGSYPNDTTFGDFMVSGRRDLSVMNDGEKFIYTNSNEIAPKNLATLSQIAGYGKSKVVDYAGTGAYFLDKLADGVWRLELMPDVVLTSDPFAKPSLEKRVARIYNREHPMRINLSDLGREFFVVGMNDGNNISQNAHDATIDILPGTYLLARKQDNLVNYKPEDSFGTMSIGEFVAPKPDDSKLVFVVHTPKETITRESHW